MGPERDQLDRRPTFERDHHLEWSRRNRRFGTLGLALIAAAALWAAPTLGWAAAVLLLMTVPVPLLAGELIQRVPSPERWGYVPWLCTAFAFSGAVAVTGGPTSPFAIVLVVSAVVPASAFSRSRYVVCLVALMAMLGLAQLAGDASRLLAEPYLYAIPAAATLAVAMLVRVLAEQANVHREHAVVDPLTGALNRSSLPARTEETLAHASRAEEAVSLIVCDVDHFKRINDEHGHQTGDAVLQEVAYLLRKGVRAFDPVYRVGGEEFVILIAGMELGPALALAERLRATLAGTSIAGVPVTVSFGVASVAGGERTSYEALFEAADAALYAAKLAGRNRVEAAGSPRAPAVAA